MYSKEKKEIDKFLLDISCLDKLEHLYDKPNIFDVLRITNNEIRHSNILAWLLDANQNHGLGGSFFLELVKLVIRNNPEKYNVEKWILADFSNERVIREWHKKTEKNDKVKNNSLDILIVFSSNDNNNGLVLGIENKVDSSEGDNQTKRYREAIEKSYKDFDKMLLFLSPDGIEPSDSEKWDTITYNDIHDILKSIIGNRYVPEDSLKIINDYITVIERDIMKNEEMIDLCTRIYKEHKTALDTIFNFKVDDSAILAGFLKKCLTELNAESDNSIIYTGKYDSGVTYVRFSSKVIDPILPDSKTEKNTWKNKKRYLFEIKTRVFKEKGQLPIAFVLTMNNLDDQTKIVSNKIIAAFPKNRGAGNQFCSLNAKSNILDDCKSFSKDDVQGSIATDEFKNELKSYLKKYVSDIEKRI